MDFTVYVPGVVRALITALIDGEPSGSHGWADALTEAKSQVAEIEDLMRANTFRDEFNILSDLQRQKTEAVMHRDELAANLDCLYRLGQDERMADVYNLLKDIFTDDNQYKNFRLFVETCG